MTNKISKEQFSDLIKETSRASDDFVDATAWCNRYERRYPEFARLPETVRYLDFLCVEHDMGKSHVIETKRGRGGKTLIHPLLFIRLIRWLDNSVAKFADEVFIGYIKADAAIALSIAERAPEPEKLQPVADVVVERSTDAEWLAKHYESTGKRLSFVRGVDVFVSPGLHPEQEYLQFLLSERFGLKPAPIAFVQTLEGGDEAFDQYLADRQPQIHKDLHTNQANTEEWDGLHGYFFKDIEQWASERCGAFKF